MLLFWFIFLLLSVTYGEFSWAPAAEVNRAAARNSVNIFIDVAISDAPDFFDAETEKI